MHWQIKSHGLRVEILLPIIGNSLLFSLLKFQLVRLTVLTLSHFTGELEKIAAVATNISRNANDSLDFNIFVFNLIYCYGGIFFFNFSFLHLYGSFLLLTILLSHFFFRPLKSFVFFFLSLFFGVAIWFENHTRANLLRCVRLKSSWKTVLCLLA